MLQRINWVAVLVSSFLYTIAGAAWYSPMLFGNMMPVGHCEPTMPMHMAYLASFVIAVVLSTCIAILMEEAKVKNLNEGVCLIAVAWLGLVAAPMSSAVVWGGMEIMHVAIKAGFVLLGALIASSVQLCMKK